jgi:hypothetical protein
MSVERSSRLGLDFNINVRHRYHISVIFGQASNPHWLLTLPLRDESILSSFPRVAILLTPSPGCSVLILLRAERLAASICFFVCWNIFWVYDSRENSVKPEDWNSCPEGDVASCDDILIYGLIVWKLWSSIWDDIEKVYVCLQEVIKLKSSLALWLMKMVESCECDW